MKTNLSHIMPVWKACQVLGRPTVYRIVSSLLHILQKTNKLSSQQVSELLDVDALVNGLMYRHPPPKYPDTALPASVQQAWTAWARTPGLQGVDKNALLRWWLPLGVQPHAGPSGHMGLFDCWIYALQGRTAGSGIGGIGGAGSTAAAPVGSPVAAAGAGSSKKRGAGTSPSSSAAATSSAAVPLSSAASWMIQIPDVLIFMAICQEYADERRKQQHRQQHRRLESSSSSLKDSTAAVAAADSVGDDDDDHDDDDASLVSESSAAENGNDGDGGAKTGSGEKDEKNQQQRQSSPTSPERRRTERARVRYEKTVWTMSLLAFRIYDSYQKKGVVARDTVHRFLTDVYGEDSYKQPDVVRLLDTVFDTLPPPPSESESEAADEDGKDGAADGGGDRDDVAVRVRSPQSSSAAAAAAVVPPPYGRNLHATVSEGDFCRRTLLALPCGTNDDDDDKNDVSDSPSTEFVLLDWISTLALRLKPPPEIPDSVQAFLGALYSKPLPLCELYQLPESRLYEIKRRFHSLVDASSPAVIQGDPMTGAAADPDGGGTSRSSSSSSLDGQRSSPSTPSNSVHRGSSLPSSQQQQGGSIPKQAVSERAFVEALSAPNDDLGSGGHLPPSLARLLFAHGCHRDPSYSDATSSNSNFYSASSSSASGYWGLYHVLHFGCIAVRKNVNEKPSPNDNPNTALLRFVFGMFQLTTCDDIDDLADRSVLTREQISHVIVALLEFADFRRRADASVDVDAADTDDTDDGPSVVRCNDRSGSNSDNNDVDNMDDWLVDEDSATVMGLLPPKLKPEDVMDGADGRPGQQFVKLRALVDYALDNVATPRQMIFEEFVAWGNSPLLPKQPGVVPSRLTLLLLELRLVAAVLFGVPPSSAQMELQITSEIDARHKERYPQSDVSRRGPRGTVWYLIDASWLERYNSLVRKQAKLESSASVAVAKNKNGAAPMIERISNTGLLAEDGTLALRPDIRWKRDYEILPPMAWSALQAWYDGGPPIYRSVVRYVSSTASSPHASATSRPRIPTENELELYPYFVTVYLCDLASKGEAMPFQQHYQVSRVSPAVVMLVQLCKELDVDPKLARLWVMENPPGMMMSPSSAAGPGGKLSSDSQSSRRPSSSVDGSGAGAAAGAPTTDDWILDLDQSIVEQRKKRGIPSDRPITLLLELKDAESGLWPRGVDGKEWSFKGKRGEVDDEVAPQSSDLGDGIVGLYNMG